MNRTETDADADDFYVNVNLNVRTELPTDGGGIPLIFERMSAAFPDLTHFEVNDDGDLVLEGDSADGSYRWLSIEARRFCSGYMNPGTAGRSYDQHETALDLAPLLLGVGPADCEALDLMYGFDFDYRGNHDEVVAEALGVGPGLQGLFDRPSSKVLHFEPTITVALDESCRTQCRLAVETRTTAVHVQSGVYPDESISVFFTVRRHWEDETNLSFTESFRQLAEVGEELLGRVVVPRIVVPLARTIAARLQAGERGA